MTALQALRLEWLRTPACQLNAMEEALAYQRLQKASTYTAEQIAAKTGKSKGNHLRPVEAARARAGAAER